MIARVLTLCLFVVCCFVTVVTAAVPAPTEEQKEVATQKLNAAVDAAKAWLAIVDSGKYRDSWGAAAQYFKDKVPADQWETSLRQVRSPFGQVVSREISNLQYTTYLPGAPAGEYAIIQFKTDFKDKHGSIETITPMLDKDGVWRVSGYYIK
jgi:hypothetical protein